MIFFLLFLNKLLLPYRGSQGLTTPPCITSDVAMFFFFVLVSGLE